MEVDRTTKILWIFNRKKIKTVNMSRKVLKFYAKGKKIWKSLQRLCYNELSQKEVCIQEEVCGWYHLLMLSKINLEYMQGLD